MILSVMPDIASPLAMLLWFLALITPLVFVHEMGHFLVARWCGVKVDIFSVGFGPELIGRTDKHGTRWRFSAIPMGGYVKFFGDESAISNAAEGVDDLSDAERAVSFHHQSLPKRSAIVAAGPIVNFLFAILIFALFFMTVGQRATPPVIGYVGAESIAEESGLLVGDRILEIDGEPIERFEEIRPIIAINTGDALSFSLSRDGRNRTVEVFPSFRPFEDRFGNTYREAYIDIFPQIPAVVGEVSANSAAAQAGLKRGDEITTVAGLEIGGFRDLVSVISARPNENTTLGFLRDGAYTTVNVVIGSDTRVDENGVEQEVGLLGIIRKDTLVRRGPLESFYYATGQTFDMLDMMLEGLGQLILGLRSIDELGGPVKIAQMTSVQASLGLFAFIEFMALISINLGLVNLFPIPALDGGTCFITSWRRSVGNHCHKDYRKSAIRRELRRF